MVSFLGLPPKYYKLGDLKQHKFISPQFWRLAVQNQGVSKAVLLLRLLGEDLASSSFSCLLAILGLQIHHPVSVTLITWRLFSVHPSVRVCVQVSSTTRGHISNGIGLEIQPTSVSDKYFILTNICGDFLLGKLIP